ncbi:MAG: hypothetical protein GY762_12625 [Proteobacteria bacterium]|nr:hypothetical protein [Pseudomonadota bacterium]
MASNAAADSKANSQPTNLFHHTLVASQQRLVPIPIYVEVHTAAKIGAVILYYRTPGEMIFQQVRMAPYGKGYAATIGCDVLQVLDPSTISYYIALKDKDNKLHRTFGTEATPYHIAIVDKMVQDPISLPGRAPPRMCKEECPPWNPDCERECKLENEPCENTGDCCSEMTCNIGKCFKTIPINGQNKAGSKPIFRLAVVFGTGAGVSNKSVLHPYNQVSVTPIRIPTTFAWSNFHFRVNPMFYLSDLILIGLSVRGGLTIDSDSIHADHTMAVAPTLLAVIAFRIVGNGSDMFELDAQFGLGGGLIYHKINYAETDGVDRHFYLESGKFVAEVGFDSHIWIIENFGINIGLMADAYLGSHFALNFDIQIGPTIRF